jgi:hypothetical protein
MSKPNGIVAVITGNHGRARGAIGLRRDERGGAVLMIQDERSRLQVFTDRRRMRAILAEMLQALDGGHPAFDPWEPA